MEVILIKDVDKLGYANDIVDVRPGYANNYLIPQGLAKSATGFGPQNTGREPQAAGPQGSQAGRRRRGARRAKIAETSLKLTAKAEEGRIFGSITAAHLAEALEAKGITVDRKSISLDAVKTIGAYEASVKIYKGISATVHFEVVAEE